jgi:hypothetical protein
MPEDLVLTVLKEMRSEASAFREETHNNFGTVFHRLSVAEAHMADVRHRLASLETHMAALLATMPVVNERIDKLEARLVAVEARLAG